MALVVKNPSANARNIRDMGWSLGQEDPLETGIATHSSILAWRIPMDRGAWRATVHRVAKSQTRLKQLSICMRTHTNRYLPPIKDEQHHRRKDTKMTWVKPWQLECPVEERGLMNRWHLVNGTCLLKSEDMEKRSCKQKGKWWEGKEENHPRTH